MISVFCVTYSFLNNKSSLSGKDKTIIKDSDLIITFDKGTAFTVGNIKPGESEMKSFSIKNHSTGAINYDIIWTYVENSYNIEKELVYTITTNNSISKEKQCPSSGANIPILKNITIDKNTTNNYVMVITHKESGTRKNTNIFKGKLEVVVNKDEVSVQD